MNKTHVILVGLLVNALFFAYSVAYWEDIRSLPERETVVIKLLLLVFTILTVQQLIRNCVFLLRQKRYFSPETQGKGIDFTAIVRSKTFIVICAITGYIILFPILGFFFVSYIFLLLGNYLLGIRNRVFNVLFPLLFLLGIYLIFSLLLGVSLPKGIIF